MGPKPSPALPPRGPLPITRRAACPEPLTPGSGSSSDARRHLAGAARPFFSHESKASRRRPRPVAIHCGVEQSVAREVHTLEVAGSSPAPATIQRRRGVNRGREPREAREAIVLHCTERGLRRAERLAARPVALLRQEAAC